MGTIMDLTKASSYDYVDNPYWSVFQIKAKYLMNELTRPIMDEDLGKVLLFVNLSLDSNVRAKTQEEIVRLKSLAERHKDQGFGVYGVFTNDIQGGDDLLNKDIAQCLTSIGVQPDLKEGLRFLSKVDVNGNEMSNLYKFLKRGSPLFIPRYGRARRIHDHNSKVIV